MGHCRVTIVHLHLRVIMGHCRVTIVHLRVTIGHYWSPLGKYIFMLSISLAINLKVNEMVKMKVAQSREYIVM